MSLPLLVILIAIAKGLNGACVVCPDLTPMPENFQCDCKNELIFDKQSEECVAVEDCTLNKILSKILQKDLATLITSRISTLPPNLLASYIPKPLHEYMPVIMEILLTFEFKEMIELLPTALGPNINMSQITKQLLQKFPHDLAIIRNIVLERFPNNSYEFSIQLQQISQPLIGYVLGNGQISAKCGTNLTCIISGIPQQTKNEIAASIEEFLSTLVDKGRIILKDVETYSKSCKTGECPIINFLVQRKDSVDNVLNFAFVYRRKISRKLVGTAPWNYFSK